MVAKAKKLKSQGRVSMKSELLFKVGKDTPKWYLVQNSDEPSGSPKAVKEKYDKQACEVIYRSEYDLYQTLYQQDQSSDYQWLQTSLSATSKVN